MRIVTFNVNGIRSLKEYYAATRRWTFDQLLDSFDADIICFQETKTNKPDLLDHDIAFPKAYHAYFSFPRVPRKTGYSGVVTYVRNSCKHPVRSFADGFARPETLGKPGCSLSKVYDIDTLERLDSEARVAMTDHGAFILFNVYFPNDGGPERAEFRERFYSALTMRCQDLARDGRNVIIACDLNTTYSPLDHCDYVKPFNHLCAQSSLPAQIQLIRDYFGTRFDQFVQDGRLLMESLHDVPASFNLAKLDPAYPALIQEYFQTKPSRAWAYFMFRVLQGTSCFIDCFRQHHPDVPDSFTCWNTLMAARGSNYGTRIDYIIATGPSFAEGSAIVSSGQMYDVMGSDHCPVWAEFQLEEAPWADNVQVIGNSQSKTQLHKQKRIDSFFKTKPKTEPATITKEDVCEIPSEEPAPKKIRTLTDSKLPFAMAKIEEPPPCCRAHGEPSRLFTVNKAGPNKGKKFYVCSRPVGHPTDSEAKCNFFQWQR